MCVCAYVVVAVTGFRNMTGLTFRSSQQKCALASWPTKVYVHFCVMECGVCVCVCECIDADWAYLLLSTLMRT